MMILLKVGTHFETVEQGDQLDESTLFPQDIHPGDPILGVMDADALFLHIEIDLHLVPYGRGVVEQVLEDGVLIELVRSSQLLLQ